MTINSRAVVVVVVYLIKLALVESYQFLKRCYDTFYLVNIVDNDFVDGDLDKVISEFINENKELIDSL